MRILISAGEVSGDTHAGAVIRTLRAVNQNISIHGIAGPAMRAAGCVAVADMESLNVMGIVDVIQALPRIRKVKNKILSWAEQHQPDIAILVDFPGFHLRLGAKLRKMGIPVVYYIAPKLWAWGAWRIRRLKHAQDQLASILPFESDWFAARGIAARYVGNPSAVACRRGWTNAECRTHLALKEDVPTLAILAGSRPQEIKYHVPLLIRAWQDIRAQHPGMQCITPLAPSVDEAMLAPLIAAGVRPVQRTSKGFSLRGVNAAIAVSGTATLELALWDVPTVLVYRTSALTVYIARKLVRLRCIGLANILLDDCPVMPELIQEQATEESIATQVSLLLNPQGDHAMAQHAAFLRLKTLLGDMDPAHEIAAMAIHIAQNHNR